MFWDVTSADLLSSFCAQHYQGMHHLRFTRTTLPKPMLPAKQQIHVVKGASSHVSEPPVQAPCSRHLSRRWVVVYRITLITLPVNRTHIGNFPIPWHNCLLRLLKDKPDHRRNLVCANSQNPIWITICAIGFICLNNLSNSFSIPNVENSSGYINGTPSAKSLGTDL